MFMDLFFIEVDQRGACQLNFVKQAILIVCISQLKVGSGLLIVLLYMDLVNVRFLKSM